MIGLLGRLLRFGSPLGRVGMGLWAWRHRHEVAGWLSFATRSGSRLSDPAGRADVVAEGRLRGRLTADARTRNLDGLRVHVDGGVATLIGMVPAAAHDVAIAIATNTAGVHRVRDELIDARSFRRRSR